MTKRAESLITGNEALLLTDQPLEALISFDRAFNTGAMGLMEQNWLQTPQMFMSNPPGGVKRGWTEIRPV